MTPMRRKFWLAGGACWASLIVGGEILHRVQAPAWIGFLDLYATVGLLALYLWIVRCPRCHTRLIEWHRLSWKLSERCPECGAKLSNDNAR